MPSLKMKVKSIKDRSKDNGLHTCNKSSMISKKPLSHGRGYRNTEKRSTCTPCNQDGETSVCDEVCILDLGGDEIIHDESSNEENLLQMHLLNVDESSNVDSMEPTPSTFASNIESIYSPISESMDFYNNEGSDSLYVPQLDSEDSDDGSRSSCGYQTCNASSLFMSDMIFSGPSNGISSGTGSKTDSVSLPDYKCEDSSLYCDLMQEYITLPFLDDVLDTGCDRSGRPFDENTGDAYGSNLYMAIHQLRSNDPASDINTYPDQDYEGFDPQLYISNLSDQQDILSSNLTPDTKQNNKHITLVLDLDETLVHSTIDHCDDADFTFPVLFNMEERAVFVKKRPHLHTFLRRVAEMFEIVIFTASQSIYAEQLLDILDPDGKIISRRAYRDSCTFSEGNYMKDLTVLGVDLAKVAIIDNTPQVFSLQVNNGIPIKSWFNDPDDYALISLLPFLETLVDADDVRPIIARKFGNKD